MKSCVQLLLIYWIMNVLACNYTDKAQIFHALGEMAGEVTESSVILQSRLTKTDSLVAGDVPGAGGFARFELSTVQKFPNAFYSDWLEAVPENDFIVKTKITDLEPATRYYYRLIYGVDKIDVKMGARRSFKTLQGESGESPVSFVVVTGMNYARHHFGRGEGKRKSWPGYDGPDKHLGYPALKTILDLRPDFFVGTGDNIYYDRNAPGQKTAETTAEMRQRWHEQFIQPRYGELFSTVPTYWEKDDHDHRYNDSDTLDTGRLPSHKMGKAIFLEQLPVIAPGDNKAKPYRTHRVSKHLQVWLMEGRDYRSPNKMPDGPVKTLWGLHQFEWLKETLLASNATFKVLISPTPLVGPDDMAGESDLDNHTNGYRHERKLFFDWLIANHFHEKSFYIISGDRHWQYHAIDPTGIEEFSTGALVDGNSRLGVKAGAPKSSDPSGKIKQLYLQAEPSGGFLLVSVDSNDGLPAISFTHHDEWGAVLYDYRKELKR